MKIARRSRARGRAIAGSIAILITVVLPARSARTEPAASQDALDRERTLYDRGVQQYQLGDYDAAIASFQAAYAIASTPSLLFNIGQAYRQKGPAFCGQAGSFYRSYLRQRPNASDRETVEARIAEMDQCQARQLASARDAVEHAEAHARTLRRAGLVTAAASAVVLGVGIYYGFQAAHDASEVSDDAARRGAVWQDAALERDGQRAQLLARILCITGAAGLATGGALYGWGRWRGGEVTVAPMAGGGGAVWTGRF